MAKTVMTLDSGGTNFVFSAISDEKEVVKPIVLSAKCSSLDEMLKMIFQLLFAFLSRK
jgi:glucokinase